jgi:hypothetical protein
LHDKQISTLSIGEARSVLYSLSGKYLRAMKLGKNADGSVLTYNLKEDHTFIVVANSALWKRLSDLEVGKLIIPFIFSQNVKMAI